MPRSLHHANLLIGGSEEAESYVRLFCDDCGVRVANNPDLFAFRVSTFGIDEARELKILAARKALTTKKIFLVVAERLTREAQNALLKTFEDPFPDTFFFLRTREEALIEPTLLSRMQAIHLSSDSKSQSTDAQKFLSLPIKDRLLFAKKFVDEEKSVPVFLDDLLLLLRQQKKARVVLESVYNIRRLAGDSLAAPRLVMEHLSLVL